MSTPLHQWCNWDHGATAQVIEDYWRRSAKEGSHRDAVAQVVSRYLPGTSATILEVGCGTGLVYRAIVPDVVTNERYLGLDISQKMLAIAQKNFPEGRFLIGDGNKLDLQDRSFDVVLCVDVIGHVPDHFGLLREILRTTRHVCIFTFWPSQDNSISEYVSIHAGAPFLHKQFPEELLRTQIETLAEGSSVLNSVSLPCSTALIVEI